MVVMAAHSCDEQRTLAMRLHKELTSFPPRLKTIGIRLVRKCRVKGLGIVVMLVYFVYP